MSTHDSAINDQTRQVWIRRKMLVHAFPHIVLAPAGKAFIDRVPLPVLRGQLPRVHHPQNRLNEAFATGFLTAIDARAFADEGENFRPLFRRESKF